MNAITQSHSCVAWCQRETANITHRLPDDKKFLEIIRRIAVVLSVIIPLIGWIGYCLDRPMQTLVQSQESTSPENQKPPVSQSKKRVILYMTLTGNPPHLGHMVPIAAAIDALAKQNIGVTRALISLSSQKYLQSKVFKDPNKIALTHEARLHILNGVIQEAAHRGMFRGVPVEFWDDQAGYEDKGVYGCDHPESYARLTTKEGLQREVAAKRIKSFTDEECDHDVYLVAGMDLCQNMRNWPSIKHAIIVNREKDVAPPASARGCTRIFLKADLYPDLAHLSSSAIQKSEQQLEPPAMQAYFKALKTA